MKVFVTVIIAVNMNAKIWGGRGGKAHFIEIIDHR